MEYDERLFDFLLWIYSEKNIGIINTKGDKSCFCAVEGMQLSVAMATCEYVVLPMDLI